MFCGFNWLVISVICVAVAPLLYLYCIFYLQYNILYGSVQRLFATFCYRWERAIFHVLSDITDGVLLEFPGVPWSSLELSGVSQGLPWSFPIVKLYTRRFNRALVAGRGSHKKGPQRGARGK